MRASSTRAAMTPSNSPSKRMASAGLRLTTVGSAVRVAGLLPMLSRMGLRSRPARSGVKR